MPDIALTALLVVANVFGAGMIVPQLVRVRRTRNIDGLSLPWVGVGTALNVWWAVYAVGAQVWGVLPVSIAGTALYGAIAVSAVPLHPSGVRAFVAGAAGASIAPAVSLAVGGWAAAGIAMGFSYGVQFAPAAIEAARSDLVDGVSPTTWVMAAIEAAIWLVYGVEVADAALLIGGAGGLLMSIVILGQLASAGIRLATR